MRLLLWNWPQMLLLMLDGWVACAFVFMFMVMIIVLMMMPLLSPMMMDDAKSFKQTLNYEKEEYCADEDKGYEFAIRSGVFICVG
jgi:hypothetical protein